MTADQAEQRPATNAQARQEARPNVGTRGAKRTLVVVLADGRERKYRVAASVAEKRLADHHAMTAALGTEHLYRTAYLV